MVRSFVSPVVLSVYPCVYREHIRRIKHIVLKVGLSLCVQGTLEQEYKQVQADRFIPVCTGNMI